MRRTLTAFVPFWRKKRNASKRGAKPICSAVPAKEIEAEIERLFFDDRLATIASLDAWIAPAAAIPRTMAEIGRLRELSFRAVGEGTGLSCDLDRFDANYLHLFLWDRSRRAIAGGYRIGKTDELLSRGGSSELYTSTLFDYDPEALRALGTALELGRSFVSPPYQRSYAPLLTLWKGIGSFVAQNPRYRLLFGPVSISADYHPLSHQILGHWLETRHGHAGLFGRVRGRTPLEFHAVDSLRPERLRKLAAGTADVAELISQIEPDERGVPILLSEYLKLGGKLMALNVDADFHDALDALVVVDLVAAPRRLLERYMGKDGAAGFLNAHESGARVA